MLSRAAAIGLATILAASQATADPLESVVLTARPGLCVLKEASTKACVMGVVLEWRAPAGDYCLYREGKQGPLKCWEKAIAGSHKEALAASSDVMFSLHDRPGEEPVAQVPVRVLSLAQKRPERRRRRHAWAPL